MNQDDKNDNVQGSENVTWSLKLTPEQEAAAENELTEYEDVAVKIQSPDEVKKIIDELCD